MSALPGWLTTLQRVREYRRDVAWQTLSQSQRSASEAAEITRSVAQAIARVQDDQQRAGQAGRVDAERLRTLHADRELQRSRLRDVGRLQAAADRQLQQDQNAAVACEADVEILQRLSDRLLAAARLEQQQRLATETWQASLSLSNGRTDG
jgi:hypothetical protein